MSLLDALLRQGALRPVDHALAQSLRRLGREVDDADDRVLVAAALASSAIAHGHAGLDLSRPQLVCDAEVEWPDAAQWRDALEASRWVASPSRGLARDKDRTRARACQRPERAWRLLHRCGLDRRCRGSS